MLQVFLCPILLPLFSRFVSSFTHVEFFDLRDTATSNLQTCDVYPGNCCVPVDIGLGITDPLWYAFRAAEVQVNFVPGKDDSYRDVARVYELPVRACHGGPARRKKLSDLPQGSNKWRTGDRNKVVSSVSYGDGNRENLIFPGNIKFMGHDYKLEPEQPGPYRRPLTYKYAPEGGITHMIYGRPQTPWPWLEVNNSSLPTNDTKATSTSKIRRKPAQDDSKTA